MKHLSVIFCDSCSILLALLLLSACQLDSYRAAPNAFGRNGLQAEFYGPYGYQSGSGLNGKTPSTAPVNCFGEFNPCSADQQSIVDVYLRLCKYPARRLCDAYNRPFIPEKFCVAGQQSYSLEQAQAACRS